MIVRPHQHWLTRLFVWHGSVLEKMYSRLLLNLLLSIAVIFFLPWYEKLGIKLTMAPFSILGVAIAIFLGFRNSVCYARFNESRLLWGQLTIAARSLTREVKTVVRPDPESFKELINLQLAFCNSLRMLLRKQSQEDILRKYLTPSQFDWVITSHSPHNLILILMGQWLNEKRQQGIISDILWQSFNAHLNTLTSASASCERMMATPVPFAYSLLLHRTVYSFCIMLPFALVPDLHYMTPLISVFVSYTFIALDTLAEELEEPFGTENNDLPLDAICIAIERDIRNMNDETNLPPALTPDRYYRLS